MGLPSRSPSSTGKTDKSHHLGVWMLCVLALPWLEGAQRKGGDIFQTELAEDGARDTSGRVGGGCEVPEPADLCSLCVPCLCAYLPHAWNRGPWGQRNRHI